MASVALVSSNSEADRLLKLSEISSFDLEVTNTFTDMILDFEEKLSESGIGLRYFQSEVVKGQGGTWKEYKILYEVSKAAESNLLIGHAFRALGTHLESWYGNVVKEFIESTGIQEVKTDDASFYYFLIYVIGN